MAKRVFLTGLLAAFMALSSAATAQAQVTQ